MKNKIYTRTGDDGTTSLYGGKRVEKHQQQVITYGTVDELNSSIGVILSFVQPGNTVFQFLSAIQSDLFVIGTYLAGNKVSLHEIANRVGEMEAFIDRLDKDLPPLKHFILPGGSKSSAFTHVARTVCRRAEREVLKLSKDHDGVDKRVIIYLNRLSDVLFVIARFTNKEQGNDDIVWNG